MKIILFILCFSPLSLYADEVKFDSTYINQAQEILQEDLIKDRKPASIEEETPHEQSSADKSLPCSDEPCY